MRRAVTIRVFTLMSFVPLLWGCTSGAIKSERQIYGCGTAWEAIEERGIKEGCLAVVSALAAEESAEIRYDIVNGVSYYYKKRRGKEWKDCVPVIEKALSDPDMDVRGKGVQLIKAALPEPEAVRFLKRVSRESDEATRERAEAALREIRNDKQTGNRQNEDKAAEDR